MQTQLIKIGNSQGIILSKKLLDQTKLGEKVEVTVEGNSIVISSARHRPNLDRSTWDKQFKDAIKAGHKPEKAIGGNTLSPKEEKEWTWPGYK